MFSLKAIERVKLIAKKITFIEAIAHDYEGVDLYIVEDVINERLPIIKSSVNSKRS